MALRYSFAEVLCKHKIIRYLKAGKGTDYSQLLDTMRVVQQANPALLVVIMHGAHHITGGSTEQDEELLAEYFQSSEFVSERLVWTKEAKVADNEKESPSGVAY